VFFGLPFGAFPLMKLMKRENISHGEKGMWARVIELMLACFLSISCLFFPTTTTPFYFWANNLLCSAFIAFFALCSYRSQWGKVHLFSFAIAIYLIILGYVEYPKPNPQNQCYVTMGILLFMITLIPSRAGTPPKEWLAFLEDQIKD
jgi:peptidoglycan/LPS O-acetylase OafA/YrhL